LLRKPATRKDVKCSSLEGKENNGEDILLITINMDMIYKKDANSKPALAICISEREGIYRKNAGFPFRVL